MLFYLSKQTEKFQIYKFGSFGKLTRKSNKVFMFVKSIETVYFILSEYEKMDQL